MQDNISKYHPELMHYTTAGGLAGIISSDCLWATQASALNDREEISHFLKMRLPEIVRKAHEIAASELNKNEGRNEKPNLIEIINQQTVELSKTLMEATLQFHSPYIFSLSSAKDARVRRNGILSQWRGYGEDGGYAIVFDTQELLARLLHESEQFFYQHAQISDVFYHGESDISDQKFSDVIECEEQILRTVVDFIAEPRPESFEPLYQPIISLSCLYKHWGFAEEQEVRIAAVPANKDIYNQHKQDGGAKEQKPISAFPRNGMLIPYIELLKKSAPENKKLPIKSIIIGPHKKATERQKTVEQFVSANGYEIEVMTSEIPYIGK